jgi:hypothetical protein
MHSFRGALHRIALGFRDFAKTVKPLLSLGNLPLLL